MRTTCEQGEEEDDEGEEDGEEEEWRDEWWSIRSEPFSNTELRRWVSCCYFIFCMGGISWCAVPLYCEAIPGKLVMQIHGTGTVEGMTAPSWPPMASACCPS